MQSFAMYEIKARDVLTYLNELGYKNIEAHQLKAFITDLKKLIKQDNYSTQEFDNMDLLFNNRYRKTLSSTDISNVKSNSGRTVTLQISQPTLPSQSKSNNGTSESSITDIASDQDLKTSCSTKIVPNKAINNLPISVASSSTISCRDNQPNVKMKNIRKKFSDSTLARPTSSFIRVKPPILKPCRSDPVALYQYYQERWKHTKIPGQDSHMDLRWTIREKMLGDHLR